MALLTTCQASFQSMKDYEDVKDDVESLKENIRECYSEISKTSEQLQRNYPMKNSHLRRMGRKLLIFPIRFSS